MTAASTAVSAAIPLAIASEPIHDRAWWTEESAGVGTGWPAVVDAALEMMVAGGILERKPTTEAATMTEDWKQVAHEAWHAPSWREAAEKYRYPTTEIAHDRLGRLRALMNGTTSFERAYHDISRNRPAPSTLVEALLLSLQRGVTELTRPDTQRRLSVLDKDQLEAVCLRAQAFQPTIARAWSAEDADLLISTWKKLHEQC
jgi:hypothetical protein